MTHSESVALLVALAWVLYSAALIEVSHWRAQRRAARLAAMERHPAAAQSNCRVLDDAKR